MSGFKNYIEFLDEDGAPYGIKHVSNKPRVSTMPYLYDISEGNVEGHTAWSKIGYTPLMTTTESDVWSWGGTISYPAAATTLSVFTYSAQDSAAGDGARAVTIYYLDSNYAEKTETVVPNGVSVTGVSTVASDILRVNGFRVTDAGVSATAAGVSLANISENTTYSYITGGFTRARNIAYTVPASKTLYVVSGLFGFGYAANQTHYCRLYTRATQNEGIKTSIFYPYTEVIAANTSQYVEFLAPTKLVEKVDIKVSGISSATGIASVALRGWLEDA